MRFPISGGGGREVAIVATIGRMDERRREGGVVRVGHSVGWGGSRERSEFGTEVLGEGRLVGMFATNESRSLLGARGRMSIVDDRESSR
jgi:hypothetical protein